MLSDSTIFSDGWKFDVNIIGNLEDMVALSRLPKPRNIPSWALARAEELHPSRRASDLRSLYNATLSIHKLPPELLSMVLATACATINDSLSIRAVCRHWNITLLANPRVWVELIRSVHWHTTTLFHSSGRMRAPHLLLEKALDRSGSLPLNIRMGNPTDATLDLLSPFLQKLVTLEIDQIRVDTPMIAIKDALTSGDMCHLSRLVLLERNNDERGAMSISWDLEPKLPALKSLHLSQGLFHPNLIVDTLVDLKLSNLTLVPLNTLVHVLARCQALEALSLLGASIKYEIPDADGDILVTLPQLRKLHICYPAVDFSYVFACLDIPRASVHLIIDNTSPGSTFGGVMNVAYPHGLPPVDRVAIEFLEGYSDINLSIHYFQGHAPRLTVNVGLSTTDDLEALNGLLSLSTTSCTTLTVNMHDCPYYFRISPKTWSDILHNIPNLRRLELIDDSYELGLDLVAQPFLTETHTPASELTLAFVFLTMTAPFYGEAPGREASAELHQLGEALETFLRGLKRRLGRLEFYATTETSSEGLLRISLGEKKLLPRERCEDFFGPERIAALKELVDVLVL